MNVFDLVAAITLDRSQYDEGLGNAKKDFDGFGDKLKKGLGTAAKIGGAAIAAFSAAAIAIGKQSIESYAQYEQLVGGVETLFGAQGKSLEEYASSVGKSADEVKAEYDKFIAAQTEVMNNADNAYKTMGLSANEYLETVTGFAAALNASLGGDTEKSAEYANRAITDMADNASKMGTSMDSIQAAYSGFSKQNYTMLDNLKLGYGGTKTEMERLIKDAEKLDKSFKASRDKNGELTMSYADIVDAIHIVQDSMGITGNAANEASKTISGSMNAARAAYKNLITGLADDNADLDKLLDNFINSVVTAGDNLLPRIEKVLNAVAEIIPVAINKLFPIVSKVITDNLPTLIDGGTQLLVALITGIAQALPQLVAAIPGIVAAVYESLKENWPAIKAAGIELLKVLWSGIKAAWGWFAGIVSEQFSAIKSSLIENWEAMKGETEREWNAIKTAISTKWDDIKTSVSAAVESVASSVSSAWTSIKTNAKTTWDGIKKTISNAIEKIKGLLKFEWKIPLPKVPVFTINGGKIPWGIGGEGVKPSISVKWNRKAYDTPFMFNKPTVYGFGDGNGGEIVYGHENLMRDIKKAIEEVASQPGMVINQYIQAVAQTPVAFASATEAYFEQARWAV